MNIFESCIHGLLAISSLITFSHFLVPNRVLDSADKLVLKSWNWLDDHNFKRMCEAAYQGKFDRGLIRLGMFLIFIDLSLNIYVLLRDGYYLNSKTNLITNGLQVFFFLNFQFFLAPIMRWVLKFPNWAIFKIIVLILGYIASLLLLASLLIPIFTGEFTFGMSDEDIKMGRIRADLPFPIGGQIIFYFALFVSSYLVSVSSLSSLLLIHCTAWLGLQFFAYMLRRSIERKGLAAFLAASSGLATIVLKSFPS